MSSFANTNDGTTPPRETSARDATDEPNFGRPSVALAGQRQVRESEREAGLSGVDSPKADGVDNSETREIIRRMAVRNATTIAQNEGRERELEGEQVEEVAQEERPKGRAAGFFKRLFGRKEGDDDLDQQNDRALSEEVKHGSELAVGEVDDLNREGRLGRLQNATRDRRSSDSFRSSNIGMGARDFVRGEESLVSPTGGVPPSGANRASDEKSSEGAQRTIPPRRTAMGLLPSDYHAGENRSYLAAAMPMVEHGRGKIEKGRHCGPHTMPLAGGISNGENLSALSNLLPLTDHHVIRAPMEQVRSKSPAPARDSEGVATPMNEVGLGSRERTRGEQPAPRALSPMGATTA